MYGHIRQLKATVLKTSKTKYDIAYIHVGTNNIRQNENATDIYDDILTATKNLKIKNDNQTTNPTETTDKTDRDEERQLPGHIRRRRDPQPRQIPRKQNNTDKSDRETEQTHQTNKRGDERTSNMPNTPEQDRYRQTTENETRQQKQTQTYKTPTRLTEDKKTPNRTYQEQQKTKTQNAQQRTDTHTIPKDMMTHFIGKGAANLKRLTKKYQVTINYETDGTIKVTGTPTNNEMTISGIQNTLTTVRQYMQTPPLTLRLTQERKRQIDPTSEEEEDEQTSKRRWMHERRVSGDTF